LVRRFFFWASAEGAALSCSASSRGHRRLEILDRQLQLLGVKPFGLAAELRTPKMAKPIVLLHHAPAFFKRRIALARKLSHQLSQGIAIVGASIDRHDDIESDSRSVVLLSTLI
jgi:hypothetical protein